MKNASPRSGPRALGPFASLEPTLLVAHRGGALEAPENTLHAFERAAHDLGADVLELDVHVTRDGDLAVFHDDDLDRTTEATGPVAARTMAELEALDAAYRFTPDGGETFPLRGRGIRVPSLRRLLEALPATPVHIELKPRVAGPAGGDAQRAADRAAAELLGRALAEQGAIDRACVGSADDELAARVAEAIPGVALFFPRFALIDAIGRLRQGRELDPESPYRVLSMPFAWEGHRLVDADLVARARAAGAWVNAWTVDEEPDMRALVAASVGGIMTDAPTLLRQVLRRP